MNTNDVLTKLIAEIKEKITEIEKEPAPEDGVTLLLQKCKINAFREVLSAVSRLKKNSLQQEQPEVDLDNHAIMEEIRKCGCNPNEFDIARHFFELGRNARKSIWHNVAEEVPTEYGSEVIVACRNKNKEGGIWLYDLIQCWEGEWEPRVNWETPVKWAYVEDLDNARKEE